MILVAMDVVALGLCALSVGTGSWVPAYTAIVLSAIGVLVSLLDLSILKAKRTRGDGHGRC